MNGHQRVTAALQGNWPDKRPVMLHNFMPAAREAGMTQAEYRASAENIATAHTGLPETRSFLSIAPENVIVTAVMKS